MSDRIIRNVVPDAATPRRVAADLAALLDAGYRLKPAGRAQTDPAALLSRYRPRYRLELFGVRYFLSDLRQDNGFSFFVGYVVLPAAELSRRTAVIHPRIFYKDSSLVWRSATHYIESENEHWVGKGDLKPVIENGREKWYTAEETTNLPFEIQSALDDLSRRDRRVPVDRRGLGLVLRNAPDDRVHPYRDFSAPREAAMSAPGGRINGGRPVAWFDDDGVPESLRFAAGFAPDFDDGVVDRGRSSSRLYGGTVLKYRIVSGNRRIQYLFAAAPRHVWIVAPQTLDRDIMSYGVRTRDVEIDEKVCIPGWEYHYIDDTVDPPELHTQLPPGFAGRPSPIDPGRADASPWNERLPVIRAFRERIGTPRR